MVKINKIPIIERIMQHYSSYGYKDFIIALGYKKILLKIILKTKHKNWNIQLIDTGKLTMTGGRIKRLKNTLTKTKILWLLMVMVFQM